MLRSRLFRCVKLFECFKKYFIGEICGGLIHVMT